MVIFMWILVFINGSSCDVHAEVVENLTQLRLKLNSRFRRWERSY